MRKKESFFVEGTQMKMTRSGYSTMPSWLEIAVWLTFPLVVPLGGVLALNIFIWTGWPTTGETTTNIFGFEAPEYKSPRHFLVVSVSVIIGMFVTAILFIVFVNVILFGSS